MLKKMMLLAVSAAALVAFAVPASASATEWQDAGEGFAGHRTIDLEGHAEFKTTTGAGVTCKQAKFTLTMVGGGDSGSVTAFSVTNPTTECNGFGALAACVPEQPDAENLGWPVTANANGTITISGIQFKATYNNCPASQIAGGKITLTPNNPESIGTLKGTGSALGEVSLAADLAVLAPNSGTYGIG
jgi:opacity protein-like surface antigen